MCKNILYSEKLSKEKTFTNFTVLWLFARSFLHKIWGCSILWHGKTSNLRKFSPRISYFQQFAKVFYLESFRIGRSPLFTFFNTKSCRGHPTGQHGSCARNPSCLTVFCCFVFLSIIIRTAFVCLFLHTRVHNPVLYM